MNTWRGQLQLVDLPQRGLPTFCRLNILPFCPFSPGFAIKVAHLRRLIPTWETASCVSKTPAIHTNLAPDVRQIVDFPQVRKPHFGWAHDHILLPILRCKAFKLYICHIFQCGKQTSKATCFRHLFGAKNPCHEVCVERCEVYGTNGKPLRKMGTGDKKWHVRRAGGDAAKPPKLGTVVVTTVILKIPETGTIYYT